MIGNNGSPNSRRSFIARLSAILGGLSGLATCRRTSQKLESRSPDAPAAPFRRVVTGFNSSGKSTIVSDGPVPAAAQFRFSAEEITREPVLAHINGNELWLVDSVPVDLSQSADPLLGKLPEGNQPKQGGIITRIIRYEPGLEYPMHTTWTLDLAIIISGRLQLLLEEGSTIVGPGDVVIQRGTAHGWRVVGDQPCVFVAVLVDGVNGHGSRPTA